MLDDTQKPETTLTSLIESRKPLVEAFNAAKEALAKADQQIAAQKQAELKAQEEARLQKIVPGDKNVLKGHDILFLLNSTNAGKGPDSLLGKALDVANEVNVIVATAGVKDAKVAGLFWGGASKTATLGMPKHNTTIIPNQGHFLPAAKEILAASTPDNVKGRQKNYIVVGSGAVADDIGHSAVILEAALKLNPTATLDFVVCNTAKTKLDELAQQLGQNVNLVKVSKPGEIHDAVQNVIKARLAGEKYTPPAPAVKTAAVKAPAAK